MNIYGNTVGHPLPDPRKGMKMSGPINMNGNRIEGIGNPVDDQDAVPLKVANDLIGTAVGTAKNELSRKLCVPNLLDNSDFRNPVNQRGQTSYTAVGYTIDRWLKNAGTIITVDENGLNFVVNTAGNSAAFYQKIANANKFLGKKLTFVVYTDKGNILSVVEIPSTYPSSASYYGTVRTKYGYIQLMILSSTENQIYAIFSPSVNCTLYRAALYEGEYTAETLPEYQPKGYANELLACNVADSGNVSGMKLLWENASPDSDFAGQTIKMDMSGWDSFIIQASTNTAFLANKIGIAGKDEVVLTGVARSPADGSPSLGYRAFKCVADGISITNFFTSNWATVNNSGNRPQYIYGIKGVRK